MDFDVASWADTEFARSFTVGRIRIGKMQGAVKEAVGVFAVDEVSTFRGFLVTCLNLGTFGIAKRDLVGPNCLAAAEESERVGGFENEDPVGPVDGSGLREQKRRKGEQARESSDYRRFPHIDQMRLRDADFI